MKKIYNAQLQGISVDDTCSRILFRFIILDKSDVSSGGLQTDVILPIGEYSIENLKKYVIKNITEKLASKQIKTQEKMFKLYTGTQFDFEIITEDSS